MSANSSQNSSKLVENRSSLQNSEIKIAKRLSKNSKMNFSNFNSNVKIDMPSNISSQSSQISKISQIKEKHRERIDKKS